MPCLQNLSFVFNSRSAAAITCLANSEASGNTAPESVYRTFVVELDSGTFTALPEPNRKAQGNVSYPSPPDVGWLSDGVVLRHEPDGTFSKWDPPGNPPARLWLVPEAVSSLALSPRPPTLLAMDGGSVLGHWTMEPNYTLTDTLLGDAMSRPWTAAAADPTGSAIALSDQKIRPNGGFRR